MEHLLRNFYQVNSIDGAAGQILASIKLNVNHEIYQGHFPEIPVVPGVCQMQIVTELLSTFLNKDLVLKTADNMKFMAVINPLINSALSVKIDYKLNEQNLMKVTSSIFFGDIVFLKFSGSFNQN